MKLTAIVFFFSSFPHSLTHTHTHTHMHAHTHTHMHAHTRIHTRTHSGQRWAASINRMENRQVASGSGFYWEYDRLKSNLLLCSGPAFLNDNPPTPHPHSPDGALRGRRSRPAPPAPPSMAARPSAPPHTHPASTPQPEPRSQSAGRLQSDQAETSRQPSLVWQKI